MNPRQALEIGSEFIPDEMYVLEYVLIRELPRRKILGEWQELGY